MVCKIAFCSEFPDIPDKVGRVTKEEEQAIDIFLDSGPFTIAYHISLVDVQTNYCNSNLLILDVKS